jgi:hypothetical protein
MREMGILFSGNYFIITLIQSSGQVNIDFSPRLGPRSSIMTASHKHVIFAILTVLIMQKLMASDTTESVGDTNDFLLGFL